MKRTFIKLAALILAGCTSGGCAEHTTGRCRAQSELLSDGAESSVSVCSIELGSSVSLSGQGAWLSGSEITISMGGVYDIFGTSDSAAINVSTQEPVKLVLNGAQIINEDGYAVFSSSDKLIIESVGASKLKGCGSDYNTALCSMGKTVFTGTGRLDIDGGLFSGKPVELDGKTAANRDILPHDSGTLITGIFILNEEN